MILNRVNRLQEQLDDTKPTFQPLEKVDPNLLLGKVEQKFLLKANHNIIIFCCSFSKRTLYEEKTG